MLVKLLNENSIMPTRTTEHAGAIDIFMPVGGKVTRTPTKFPLGFATKIPVGYVGLLAPRSSTGSKNGLEVTNTIGYIDADYRGEWIATLNVKEGFPDLEFNAGDRLVQVAIVPVLMGMPTQVDELDETERGDGGFGSSGK